jgi:hypothetical protein
MGQLTQFFQPPIYWQQFEDLTHALFRRVFEDPTPTKHGRPGQSQHGVDVYGTYAQQGWQVGIQCKRMDELDENNNPFPGGVITTTILNSEYDKALHFRPKLNLWILATTAKRDAKIQEVARKLDEKSRKRQNLIVKLWFWDDYVTYLNNFDDLQQQYYSSVLNMRTDEDQDIFILELYAMAFSRPAFQVPLRHEGPPDEFLDAIRDTKRALNTGELLDRQTRHVIRKVLGGRRYIQNDSWRRACDSIYLLVSRLESEFKDGRADGRVNVVGQTLHLERQLERRLEDLRSKCVNELNKVLTRAGLQTI